MAQTDPNSFLAPPAAVTPPGAVRWYASEVVVALCDRAELPRTGPHVRLLRGLLLAAWRRGESPSLDGLLDAALRGGWAEAGIDPGAVLALSLRFVSRAPEFGGREMDGPAERVYARLGAARACLAPPSPRFAPSLLCARLDARAAA